MIDRPTVRKFVLELAKREEASEYNKQLFAITPQRYRFNDIAPDHTTLSDRERVAVTRQIIANGAAALREFQPKKVYDQFLVMCAGIEDALNSWGVLCAPPAFVYCAKKISGEMGDLAGGYTLFNKLGVVSAADTFASLLKQRVTDWLLTKKEPVPEMMRRLFEDKTPSYTNIPFKDFLLNRENWATAGSVDARVPAPFKHNKAGFAYSLTDEQLIAWWFANRHNKPVCEVFIKGDEVAGVRTIVLTDLVTHIKLSYLGLAVDPLLANDPVMYNYWPPDKRLQFTLDTQQAVADGWYAADLDGSNWDGTMRKMYTAIVVDNDIKACMNIDPDAGLETLVPQLLHSKVWYPGLPEYDPPTIVDAAANIEIAARNELTRAGGLVTNPELEALPDLEDGLPSGLRYTTRVNSQCCKNLIAAVREYLATKGIRSHLPACLGDDFHLMISRYFDLRELASVYSANGFVLNIRKSKMTAGSAEFLKIIYTADFNAGDPVRALRAILYGSAELERDRDVTIPAQRAALWAKFFIRSRLPWTAYLSHMYKDLRGAMAAPPSKAHYVQWLATAPAFGGAGFNLQSRSSFSFLPVGESPTNPLMPIRPTDQGMPYPLWRKGIQLRLQTLSRKQPIVQEVLHVLHKENRPIPMPSLALIAEYKPMLYVPPAIKDSVKFANNGVTSRRTFDTLVDSIAYYEPTLAIRLRDYSRTRGWRVAQKMLGGNLFPPATAPALSFVIGEAAGEQISPLITANVWMRAPRKHMLESLPGYTVATQLGLLHRYARYPTEWFATPAFR